MRKYIGKTEPHKEWSTKGDGCIDKGAYVGKYLIIGIDKENASKEAPQSHGNDKI